MTTRFGGIESFGPLDGNLFQFSDLPDQLCSLGELSSFFILTLLQSLLKIPVNFVSNRFVILLLQNNLLSGSFFVRLHLSDDFFLLQDEFLLFQLSLIHHDVHFSSHFID